MPGDRYDAGRQPAGRAPAPGRLAFVQAFLNSFWDLGAGGADRWADPAGYGAWLRERGFAPGDATSDDLARATELREALRALARANHDDGERDQRRGATAPHDRRPAPAPEPRRAHEHRAPAARAALAPEVLREAAMGAGARHLTSVDIVSG